MCWAHILQVPRVPTLHSGHTWASQDADCWLPPSSNQQLGQQIGKSNQACLFPTCPLSPTARRRDFKGKHPPCQDCSLPGSWVGESLHLQWYDLWPTIHQLCYDSASPGWRQLPAGPTLRHWMLCSPGATLVLCQRKTVPVDGGERSQGVEKEAAGTPSEEVVKGKNG